jgi:myo-inositol-1(or 4)-monophosphatase
MSEPMLDPSRALATAANVAREAGAILLEEFHHPQKIEYKGEVDIVTQADLRSERLITARLRETFPEYSILGEEMGEQIHGGAGNRYLWCIDPLDGTTNFAHGFPVFAVSIGLLEDGDPILGAVFNPVAGEMFTALRGGGAWLNDRPIRVSAAPNLAVSLLGTGFPSHKRSQNPNINFYWEFTLRSHGVRRAGSAALDLCSVACGRFDAFWEFGLKPWDTAAGILLVREAGGQVSDFAGRAYHPGDPELVASNLLIHEEFCRVAREIAARLKAG